MSKHLVSVLLIIVHNGILAYKLRPDLVGLKAVYLVKEAVVSGIVWDLDSAVLTLVTWSINTCIIIQSIRLILIMIAHELDLYIDIPIVILVRENGGH